MRVALCLHGLVGGRVGKNGGGGSLDARIAAEAYQRHLLRGNEVDVFIHSWSVEAQDELLELYQPKMALIEPQRDFPAAGPAGSELWRAHSRWFSTRVVTALKSVYERQQGFTYDMVMLSRLDVAFFTDIDFREFDPGYFWVSHWNDAPHASNNFHGNRINQKTDEGFLDMWFFSGSRLIDRFASLYDHIGNYHPNPHVASRQHLLTITDRIQYVFYRCFDYEAVRRKPYRDAIYQWS